MDEDEVVIDSEAKENRGRQEVDFEVSDVEEKVDAKASKLKAELEACKKEKQEYLDGWQRAKADYANALRRFEEEKKVAQGRGALSAVKALLPAFDAIERAKEHGEVPEGFIAIVKQLEGAFASLGLVSVGKIGEAFDPNIHEALGTDVVEKKVQEDTVTSVLEKGWRSADAIIRPAKVRVGHFES